VLAQPELIMPVQYFYAYLARQQQDWQSWSLLMQLAAKQGYPDAQESIEKAVIPTAP
jgi:cbb3-type cytochrome oxidase cytochrome c subunit